MEKIKGGSDAPKSESIFLQIVEHPDGSVTRPAVPLAPPVAAGSDVISKDVSLDEAKGTWLRLYLPSRPPPPPPEAAAVKLPILLYLHGGGFVLFSPDFFLYNAFCERAAAALPALVASLHYRLSPEHRLPLAYDDAADALRWLAGPSADPWVASHGDLSRCFLAGSSSGGNIAYHAALRAGIPVKLAGVVMIQPYFGGEERTESEAGSGEDPVLPLRASDMMWRMALPAGASRDHEYCNLTTTTTELPVVEKGTSAPPPLLLPRCLVTGCKGDPLFDRQVVFAEMLEKAGAAEEVVVRFEDEGYHAIELFEPACAEKLLAEVREFVYGSGSK